MNGTPKVCVANDFRPRVKLSLWPFCKWILAPTKAILATFDFQRCQQAPYFASRSGWPDSISNLCSDYPEFLSGTWIRQTCSNEKALTRPAEGRTGIIANQR